MSVLPRGRRGAAAAALLAAGLLTATAACGGGGSDGKAGGAATAKGKDKVTLTFWDWDPNIDKVVAKWNAGHPDIQVKLSNPAGGDQLVAKMITAHEAKNGPDIAKVEYQSLPALVSKGVVADITQWTKDTVTKYDDATLKSTVFQGKVYGVPQDVAPLMFFYRTDLFAKYGLSVPKTWDDFAAEAKTVRSKAPSAYLTNFDAADPGWFTGLAQQAGANWWTTSGDSWKVDIADAPTKKVAGYWQGLVDEGSIAKNPSFSPQWNKQMNDGTLLGWISGAWAPAQLGGIAPATKGKWAVAPLPAWTAGDPATGIWGGSATTVTTDSHHPEQAAQFASWLNTDDAAVTEQVRQINVYPAATAGRSLPVLAAPPAFFPNQPDFYAEVKKVAPAARSFPMWGPDVTVTFTGYTDGFGKALQSGGSFTGALDSMQSATVADMKKLGFTVG
ncbi:ABC transporter substrate-binding protein [Actinacidiphila bryophytorum]|uniref:Carbohydrate ABC transporter substrate-binding protein, CUT1 family n=1 Tax=Actinacidiphila bryophytorum TaxID=1436133 RepID=A0A9W4H7J1_9ACTN|nr:sugar ABC transporter substrate-binding protein [Actinacidiphila bryophytorum]MBM9437513.1 sugar ABC transporter substrate-binding protein [Actinacidiphila bryophytorum]MBN6544754.1 sugar ABC transporter substrate-binding protein [Actinacidiphila bryophytorum]CAG7656101.1 Carbohydrate ABC transporter substrate-binding protein, CUT1 family [Actinacidiphila bryophytorum]